MKYLTITTAAALCITSSNGIAESATECRMKNTFNQEHRLLCAKPEIGIDVGFTRAQFKSGEGDKMFNRKLMPFNVFFGLNMSDRWGIEIGYGESGRKHNEVRLGAGESSPGAASIPADRYQIYDTALSIAKPYVSIKYKHYLGPKLHLFGAVGVTSMKIQASWENINDTGAPPSPMSKALRTRSIEIRKNIPLVKAGAYYDINNSFSLRLLATWSQTSKLQQYVSANGIGGIAGTIKNKDNIHYSLGLVYKI